MPTVESHAPAHTGDEPSLICHHEGAIAVLTLNNPAKRNCLSEAMIDALHENIKALSTDNATQAIVLAAKGPVFSAGHDLKELTANRSNADRGRAYFQDILARCAAMMLSIVHAPKPVIAAVEGMATAAGCQLVATCDLAVAGASAGFCTPGVNIGLFCSTPMVALSRKVSRKRAMEMLLLGDMVSAEDAADYGLINRVVPDGEALSHAMTFAQIIASKSPATIAIGKEAFYTQIEMSQADAYDYATQAMVRNMLLNDAEEGMGAFLEKRTPRWRGN